MDCDPQDTSIVVTEPVLNPIANRKKMAEILFENFGFNRFQVGIQAVMSLYCEALHTALLLDSGDGVSHSVAVIEGNIIKTQVERMNIAGRHITTRLVKLLQMRGYNFNSTADFELVREIKEKMCFVSGDLASD
jgi:actin-related protein 2